MSDTPSTIDVVRGALYGTDVPVPTPYIKPPRPPQRVVATNVPVDETTIKAKDEMRAKLKDGVYLVEFMKVTGEPATMECTLHPGLLPPMLEENVGGTRAELPHLLVVYAIDRMGWRSFDVRRVTKFEPHQSSPARA